MYMCIYHITSSLTNVKLIGQKVLVLSMVYIGSASFVDVICDDDAKITKNHHVISHDRFHSESSFRYTNQCLCEVFHR